METLEGQGFIDLIDYMGNDLKVVNAARVSFNKESTIFEEKDKKLLRYLISNKHLTPLEHVQFTFHVKCPLFIRSQWFRHRTHSFNEVSRRYTSENIEFFVPTQLRKQSDDNKQASTLEVSERNLHFRSEMMAFHDDALSMYEELINNGICREQARGVLPQNMLTQFWDTVNLRNLIDFIGLRDHKHSQKEIQEYAIALKALIQPIVPEVYNILWG